MPRDAPLIPAPVTLPSLNNNNTTQEKHRRSTSINHGSNKKQLPPVSQRPVYETLSVPAKFYRQNRYTLPMIVTPEHPEPLLLVCAVVCRVCRSLIPVMQGLTNLVMAKTPSFVEVDPVGPSDKETADDDTNPSKTSQLVKLKLQQANHHGVVKCNRCNESTPISEAPEGRRFIRCTCGCLFLSKDLARRTTCPREYCHRILEVTPSRSITSQAAIKKTA